MKLPAKFHKWSNEQQRSYIKKRVTEIRKEESELLKINRLLICDRNFVSKVDEYGTLDYEIQKP